MVRVCLTKVTYCRRSTSQRSNEYCHEVWSLWRVHDARYSPPSKSLIDRSRVCQPMNGPATTKRGSPASPGTSAGRKMKIEEGMLGSLPIPTSAAR
jgi:hypothetical protein